MHRRILFLKYALFTNFLALTAATPAICHASQLNILKNMQKNAGLESVLLYEKFKSIDADYRPGNTIYSDHYNEFECFSIGVLKNKSEKVIHLYYKKSSNYIKNNSQTDVDALSVRSETARAFHDAAHNMTKISKNNIETLWSINCVGKYGIIDDEYQNSPPSFQLDKSGQVATIVGPIENNFSSIITKMLSSNPKIKEIRLGSGGGNVYEAMLAGITIRQNNITTRLYANCYSACPLVFMGGIERQIFRPYYKLGFHKVYATNNKTVTAAPINSAVYRDIADYVDALGINSKYILELMHSANPEAMREVEAHDIKLCNNNVVTFVQSICY